MKRAGAWACLCILAMGCEQQHIYLIDFSQAPGFEWDGKVKITKTRRTLLGPLLTQETDWDVDRIEFVSRDGRSASIDTRGYREIPVATLDLGTPAELEILGTRGYWDGGSSVVTIMDANAVKALVEVHQAVTQPSDSPDHKPLPAPVPHFARMDLKPYAKHVDELDLTDWWAIALQEGSKVTVEFQVPDEQLRIVLTGDSRQYGPSVLEVWTADGHLLKRFEQEPILVRELEPDEAKASSQPTESPPR